MSEFRCKFLSGDGAYKYLYLQYDGWTPPNRYKFGIIRPLHLSLVPKDFLGEASLSSHYREYELSGREGKTWLYREV